MLVNWLAVAPWRELSPESFAQPGAQLPQVPFEEAVADIIRREPVLANTATEVAAVYQSGYGFAVARSTSLKVTERVQKAIADAAREGRTLSEAEDILSAIGKWTRSYSETVYRTNLNTAYTAGRMEQAKDPVIREVMGAYERVAINDADVRRGRRRDNGANHLAASGLIASIDDRIWDTHATPSGYNCRCSMRLVSRAELERKGLIKGNRVVRRVPANFSAFRSDQGFSPQRPDRTVYG